MRYFLAGLLALYLGLPAWAQDVLPVPVLVSRVIDQTGTLTPAQRSALEAKLAAFEAEAGPQIVILIVPTTQPEDNASYAQRVADSWKIGRREVGDGLLIVVAKNDRKIRIEVAKALEGAVPDLAARQIIQNAISPAFKKDDYAGGLNQAVDQLQARIRGEHLPAPTAKKRLDPSSGMDFEDWAALLFVGIPVLGMVMTAMMGRKLGSVATAGIAGTGGYFVSGMSLWVGGLVGFAALVLVGLLGMGASRGRSGFSSRRGGGGYVPPIIWGGGGGGGGGSFGGGGGDSFSSGGGGDFGGGGASGDW